MRAIALATVDRQALESGLAQATELMAWPPFGSVQTVVVEWLADAGNFVFRREPDVENQDGSVLRKRATVEVNTDACVYIFRWDNIAGAFDMTSIQVIA